MKGARENGRCERSRAGMTDRNWEAEFAAAQALRRANVVCMKWGTRYGPEWVNRLYGMVARNTTWTIRFVCFTDDAQGIRSEVECQPLPEVRFDAGKIGKYWPKLGLMQEGLGGLEGMTLFLDLDLVIIDSLDAFFELPGRFLIIREWKDPQLGYGNSSVVRFFIGRENLATQWIPGYDLFNGRISLAGESGRWDVALYSNNVFDKRYVVAQGPGGFAPPVGAGTNQTVTYGRPRSFGVVGSFTF